MKSKLLAVFLGASSLLSSGAMAADLPFPHIETQGMGEVIAQPDMAVFSVNVEQTRTTAQHAKQAVDKAVAAFVQRLTDAGVERKDISSANIHLSPQYRYPKDKDPELTGYRASRNVTVTVQNLENLNVHLDGALGDGINRINNIELKVADESKYQEQARQEAIKDAKAKAESLAKGFGESIEGVWVVSYHGGGRPTPVTHRLEAMPMSWNSSAAVNNSYSDTKIIIRDNVSVTFKLAH